MLVHEMVTGVTPWRHTNIYTLYDMIIDQAFTWDSQHQSGYIKTPCIITIALHKHPVLRPLDHSGQGPQNININIKIG